MHFLIVASILFIKSSRRLRFSDGDVDENDDKEEVGAFAVKTGVTDVKQPPPARPDDADDVDEDKLTILSKSFRALMWM